MNRESVAGKKQGLSKSPTLLVGAGSLLAMAMSSLFEHKRWPPVALVGVALVLWGQWQLLRARPVVSTVPAPLRQLAPTAPAPLQQRR